MAKAKLTRQEEQKLQKEMEEKKKQLLKQKEEEKQKRVSTEYDSIIRVVQQSARRLKDDELSMLHDKLQKFFNKII